MNWRTFFHPHAGIALIVCFSLVSVMRTVEFKADRVVTDTGYELTPPFFRFVTAGFWPAAVDYLWIETLQGIGQGDFPKATLARLVTFYRLVQNLDPDFFESYEHGAISFAMYFEAPEAALEVLDRGILAYESGRVPQKFWTRPYSLYLLRAYTNSFVKGDFKAAKIDYLRASEVPGSPLYLQNMKKWLKEEGAERVLAVRVLKQMILHADDPELKSKYEQKLRVYEN
jgi:hypothetical protein